MESTIEELAGLIAKSSFFVGVAVLLSAAYSGRLHLGEYKLIDKRSIQERRNLLILGFFLLALSASFFAYLHNHGTESKPVPAPTQQAPKSPAPASPKPYSNLIISPPKPIQPHPRNYHIPSSSPANLLPKKDELGSPRSPKAISQPVQQEPITKPPSNDNDSSGDPIGYPGVR